MKKLFLPVLGVLGMTALASGIAATQEVSLSSLLGLTPDDSPTPLTAVSQAVNSSFAGEVKELIGADPQVSFNPDGKFITPSDSVMQLRKVSATPHPIASVDELVGSYVQNAYTLTTSSGDTGNATSITRVEDTDTIVIERFWCNNNPQFAVKAYVDTKAGTISIPSQVMYTDASVNSTISLCVCTTAGKPDRTAKIQGVIDAEGNISLTSWWGFFVDEGDKYKDLFICAYQGSTFRKANGNIRYHLPNDEGLYGYDVRITQKLDNVVTVENFANYGLSIDLTLNADRTGSVPNAVVANVVYNSALQQAYPISNLVLNDKGNLTNATWGINFTAPEGNNKQLSWGPWSFMVPSVVWFGERTDGTLNFTDGEFSFPKDVEANFEGQGTEASPYLIKTLDDLNALAKTVNTNTDYNYKNIAGSAYARVYLGKHFRLENDIDMSTTRFTPIGTGKWSQRFAGSFDGNGHKLIGMNVDISGQYGMGGLFGIVDTLTVIKNLTMVNPVIKSTNFTGGIVGWCMGSIQNCKVINPTITNTGIATGGIVGGASGKYINNCSVEGGEITGLGGFIGGVAGEVAASSEGGKTTPGSISNCHATDIVVNGWNSSSQSPLGGVVGNVHTANIDHCYFSGVVNGAYSYAGTYPYMCAGGVAGVLYCGKMSNCFAVGDFLVYGNSSDGAFVGGVVGKLRGDMENSYATGRVYGYSTRNSGGLAGYAQPYIPLGGTEMVKVTATNCYAATQTFAETYLINNSKEHRELIGQYGANNTADTTGLDNYAVITNCYYNDQLTDFGGKRFSATTAQLTSANGPEGFSSANWVFEQGAYPRLKGMDSTEAAYASASAVDFDGASSSSLVMANTPLKALGETRFYLLGEGNKLVTKGNYAEVVNNSMLQIGDSIGTETLIVVNGTMMYPITIKVAPVKLAGNGTEANPFQIKTKDDLIWLANATTVKDQLFPGIYFKMLNDIDLENDLAFIGICANWTLQGSHNQFEGIFDGDNHTIHNMKLAGLVFEAGKSPEDVGEGKLPTVKTGSDAVSSHGYTGFIGRLGTQGVLKNIRFAADCDLTMFATCGAAVGYSYGTIENVRNYADVTGYSCWVGGICGQSIKGSVIRDCFNAGNITTGYNMVGGIVGKADGLVINCANTGDIRATRLATNFNNQQNYSGGICGSASTGVLVNVLNTGAVTNEKNMCGGISGALSKTSVSGAVAPSSITGGVNYGMVTDVDLATIGGLYGNADGGVAKGAYYDAQIIPYGAANNTAVDGCNAAQTTDLTSGKPLEGLSADAWDFTPGLYPVLKSYLDEPTVIAARKMIVTMPAGMTATDLRGNSTLSQEEGMTWTLAEDNQFKINGATLEAPVDVETPINNVLTCNYQGLTKVIPISAKPACPVSGAGTQESPWIISNASEWNALSQWQQMMMDDFTGRYIRLSANIDFTGVDIMPFGSLVTMFNGVFDGDGNTVSGFSYAATATYQGGAFIKVNGDAVIKNVTFKGDVTSAKSNYIGGVAGDFSGTMDNVVSEVNVTTEATGRSYFGGFVGRANTGAKFNKCVFRGKVLVSTNNAGGIAATTQAGVEFTECGNEGTVGSTNAATGNSVTAVSVGGLCGTALPGKFVSCYNRGILDVAANTSQVGGLVGNAPGAANVDPYEFTDCWNEGNITARAIVGGIYAATGSSSANNRMLIKGCYNTGNLSLVDAGDGKAVSSSGIGGIGAYLVCQSVVEDCYNIGTISNAKSVYAAGLFGYYKGSATADTRSRIVRCYNAGKIDAQGNQGGGIIGYFPTQAVMDSCYNTGEITGNFMLGGLVSAVGGNSVISNCWNTGKVHGVNQVGGIASWATSNTSRIVNCWNSADIEAEGLTAGINTASGTAHGWAAGGIVSRATVSIENCYNTGNVTGASRVGGIVGEPTRGNLNEKTGVITANTRLYNCYNAGKVRARMADLDGNVTELPDSCGYLIGTNPNNPVATGNTAGRWSEYNVCENCYYLDDVNTESNLESPGIAVNTTMMCGVAPVEDDKYVALPDSAWTLTRACLPTLKGFCATDEALLASINIFCTVDGEMVLATGEDVIITTPTFIVGMPQGASWSNLGGSLEVDDMGNVKVIESLGGLFTMTVFIGEQSRLFELNGMVEIVGIDSVGGDGREVIDETWYTLQGIMMPRPEAKDGRIYIVTFRYSDGTTDSKKVLNK